MKKPSWNRGLIAAGFLAVVAALPTIQAQNDPARVEQGIAVAIVFDTSGSMKDPVKDAAGKMTPKYVIANRALEAIVDRLEGYARGAGSSGAKKLEAGLVVFQANHAQAAVNYGRFDGGEYRSWTKGFKEPVGATPLGEATQMAANWVLASRLPHKHVLVVTDGMNTAGPDPAAVLLSLKQAAERRQTAVAFHVVAFDVQAKVFDPIKKLGATVVGAADEKQLNTQLEFILQRKILLEDEEPPAKPETRKS
jgi:hypothetical protein